MISDRMTRQAASALWVLLTITWAPGVQAEPCEHLEIFTSIWTPLDTQEICIERFRTPDCRKFVDTFNEADLPQPFRVNKPSIEKPDGLSLTELQFEFNFVIYPGLQVEWANPLSGVSKRSLLGFLVIWYARNSLQKYCQIFHLNGSSHSIMDDLKYKFKIPKVEANATLVVQVYSLPPPPLEDKDNSNTFVKKIFFTSPAKFNPRKGYEPAKWSPTIAFRTFTNGSIDIIFSHPPSYMDIFLYQIVLVSEANPEKMFYNDEYKVPQSPARPPEGTLRVWVPASGCYSVTIEVKELEYLRLSPGYCACWTIDLADNPHCENYCSSSQARLCLRNISAVTPPNARPPERAKKVQVAQQPASAFFGFVTEGTAFMIIASVLGILMGVSIVILMSLIIIKCLPSTKIEMI